MKRRKFLATAPAAATATLGSLVAAQATIPHHSSTGAIALPPPALDPELVNRIRDWIDANYDWGFDIFKHLNQCPEILFDLPKTAAKVREVLEGFKGIEGFECHEGLAPCSFVAILRNGPGKTFAYRTDLDALEVEDATTNPWSVDPKLNRSHSCGHSSHAAIGLSIFKIMIALRSEWGGTFLLYAQASEEGGNRELGSGAQCMIRNGLYQKFPMPEAVLAVHVAPDLAVGKVRVRKGFAFAHATMFDLYVHGVAGHGGAPYKGAKDAILLTCRIVEGLQSIVSRELSPLEEQAIISVGSIHGGKACNALPKTVHLTGTIRCFSEVTYEKILKAIKRIADAQAMAAEIEPKDFPELLPSPVYAPQLYNDPAIGDRLLVAYSSVLDEKSVEQPTVPVSFGEDFENFHIMSPDKKVAIFLTWIGSVAPQKFNSDGSPKEYLPPLHNGGFSPYWNPQASTDTFRSGVLTQACALLSLFKG